MHSDIASPIRMSSASAFPKLDALARKQPTKARSPYAVSGCIDYFSVHRLRDMRVMFEIFAAPNSHLTLIGHRKWAPSASVFPVTKRYSLTNVHIETVDFPVWVVWRRPQQVSVDLDCEAL